MDNNNLFEFARYLMIFIGIWRLEIDVHPLIKMLYFLYSMLQQTFLITFATGQVINLIGFFLNGGVSKMLLLEVVGNSSFWIVNITKLMICQKTRTKILIQQALESQRQLLKSKNNIMLSIYRNQVRFAQVMISVTTIWTCSTGLFMALSNFVNRYHIGRFNREHNATLEKPWIFQIWLPYDKCNHMFVTQTMHTYAVFIIAVANTVSNSFVTTMMVYTKGQLLLLQTVFKDMHGGMIKKKDEEVIEFVRDNIRKHQNINKFVKNLNECLKYLLLLEFFLNALNVASVCVQAIYVRGSATSFVYLVLYCGLLIFQIFLLGWNANEIKMQSLALSDALYKSEWYNQNTEAKQLMRLMILRAQKPLQLTIGPFDALTTQTALSTMKAAYSYVTLMMRNT